MLFAHIASDAGELKNHVHAVIRKHVFVLVFGGFCCGLRWRGWWGRCSSYTGWLRLADLARFLAHIHERRTLLRCQQICGDWLR